MPEGPELKTSCEKIKSLIKGKIIINAAVTQTSRFAKHPIEGFKLENACATVEEISVKGKLMYWTLSNGQYMLNTYGMTGQWSEKESKHTAFTLSYKESISEAKNSDYKLLHFNDPRHFGTIKYVNHEGLKKKLNSLGWDPLSESLTDNFSFLKKKINKKSPIGEILMDQKIFCGVGNYIRAEALYRSKINPWKQGKDVTDLELSQLSQNIVDVMQESYRAQGASFSTYENVDGSSGKYGFNFQVYGQKKDPLGYNIVRENMGTRTIHWCPEVQGCSNV